MSPSNTNLGYPSTGANVEARRILREFARSQSSTLINTKEAVAYLTTRGVKLGTAVFQINRNSLSSNTRGYRYLSVKEPKERRGRPHMDEFNLTPSSQIQLAQPPAQPSVAPAGTEDDERVAVPIDRLGRKVNMHFAEREIHAPKTKEAHERGETAAQAIRNRLRELVDQGIGSRAGGFSSIEVLDQLTKEGFIMNRLGGYRHLNDTSVKTSVQGVWRLRGSEPISSVPVEAVIPGYETGGDAGVSPYSEKDQMKQARKQGWQEIKAATPDFRKLGNQLTGAQQIAHHVSLMDVFTQTYMELKSGPFATALPDLVKSLG